MRIPEFFRKQLRYLGPVGFCILVAYVGPGTIVAALREAQPLHVIVALGLNVPLISLKAVRWRVLMRTAVIEVGLWTSLRIYFASLFIGFLTPGRVGEIVKAAHISAKTGAKLSRTLPSTVIDRLFDLYVLVVVGIAGLFRFGLTAGTDGFPGVPVVALLLLGLPMLGLFGGALRKLKRSQRVERVLRKLPDVVAEAVNQAAGMSARVSLTCLGITILAYLVFFFQCQIGAWSVHLHVSFVDMVLVMAVTSLVSLVPVSVAGIGVRDASLVILLGTLGVSNPQALAFSVVVLVVSYVGSGLIGAGCWLWEPIAIRGSAGKQVAPAAEANRSDSSRTVPQ